MLEIGRPATRIESILRAILEGRRESIQSARVLNSSFGLLSVFGDSGFGFTLQSDFLESIFDFSKMKIE